MGTAQSPTADTGEGSGPTSSESGASTTPSRDCAGACVPIPPPGWVGPVSLEAPEDGCSEAFPDLFEEFFTGLDAPAAECGCECGEATANCGDLQLVQGAAAACVGASTNLGNSGNCVSAEQLHICGRGRWAGPPTGVGCAPEPVVEVPPATWSVDLLACTAPVSGEGCAGEVCVAEANDLCVVREGSHKCPSDYPELRTFYLGVEEGRGCSECECTPGRNVACATELRLYQSPGCTGLIDSLDVVGPDFSDESANTQGLSSANFTDPAVTGSCAPSGGDSVGEATERDPYSVCCR